jgi:NDP-sugar pyrophosphorylase family protein
LAAGKGTRLKSLGKNIPKGLMEVGGKTCLEHIMLGMKEAGITRFGIVIGHLGEQIQERFGSGEGLGVEITYLVQDLSVYGTARAAMLARDLAGDEPIMVSYGDIIVHPDNYPALAARSEGGKYPTNSVNWVEDPYAGAAVYLRPDDTVERIEEKPPKGTSTTNWNNSGIYVYPPIVFDYIDRIEQSARGEYELSNALRLMVEDGLEVRSHKIFGYWRDIGRPEDLEAINELLAKEGQSQKGN